MPIGIIIMAVLGIAAFIAAKCCGVKIDPIGRIKNFPTTFVTGGGGLIRC